MIDEKMLESLRCPIGKSPLRYKDNLLVCSSCGLIFSIIDGIPDLLIDDASLPEGIKNTSELNCQKR
jgi:uncharacterized protein YbaR (Trm112 family)